MRNSTEISSISGPRPVRCCKEKMTLMKLSRYVFLIFLSPISLQGLLVTVKSRHSDAVELL